MQKNLFILISYLILTGCEPEPSISAYINKKGIVLYRSYDSLFVYYPNVIFNTIFIKSTSSDLYCTDSYNLACYNKSRNSYQSCLSVESTIKDELIVNSEDSCTYTRLNDGGDKFTKINFKAKNILWDSIRVSVSDYITTTERTIGFTEARNMRYRNHPFTAEQEVYFLFNTNFGPVLAESSKHLYYKFEIFQKGKRIVLKEGDILPSIFKSILII